MNLKEYFKIKKEMTQSCSISCDRCKLFFDNNGKQLTCHGLEYNYPEEAIEIVKKWKEENTYTYLKEFKKRFPYTEYNDAFILDNFCACQLFKCSFTCQDHCTECWNQEYLEE